MHTHTKKKDGWLRQHQDNLNLKEKLFDRISSKLHLQEIK